MEPVRVGNWATTVYLSNVDVLDSYAAVVGGGIFTAGIGYLDIDQSMFQGNIVDESGGSVMNIREDVGVTLTDSVLDSNESNSSTGAIWCSGTQGVTLVDSEITANLGGGVGVHTDCTLNSDNTDFGTGATDNDSYDVWMWNPDIYYLDYGAGASFTCEGTGECY